MFVEYMCCIGSVMFVRYLDCVMDILNVCCSGLGMLHGNCVCRLQMKCVSRPSFKQYKSVVHRRFECVWYLRYIVVGFVCV